MRTLVPDVKVQRGGGTFGRREAIERDGGLCLELEPVTVRAGCDQKDVICVLSLAHTSFEPPGFYHVGRQHETLSFPTGDFPTTSRTVNQINFNFSQVMAFWVFCYCNRKQAKACA